MDKTDKLKTAEEKEHNDIENTPKITGLFYKYLDEEIKDLFDIWNNKYPDKRQKIVLHDKGDLNGYGEINTLTDNPFLSIHINSINLSMRTIIRTLIKNLIIQTQIERDKRHK